MTTLEQAARQALEALEEYQNKGAPFMSCDAAINALRQALENAAQNEYIDAWASSIIKQKDTSGWFYEIMLVIMSLICFGFIGFLVVTL